MDDCGRRILGTYSRRMDSPLAGFAKGTTLNFVLLLLLTGLVSVVTASIYSLLRRAACALPAPTKYDKSICNDLSFSCLLFQ